jgi:hypothetical protein
MHQYTDWRELAHMPQRRAHAHANRAGAVVDRKRRGGGAGGSAGGGAAAGNTGTTAATAATAAAAACTATDTDIHTRGIRFDRVVVLNYDAHRAHLHDTKQTSVFNSASHVNTNVMRKTVAYCLGKPAYHTHSKQSQIEGG